MSTATETEAEEWVSKEQAAALMNVKPRQVEKRAQAGYIEKRYLERRLNERSARVQYSLADIVAFLAGTPNHCEAVDSAFPEKIGEPKYGDGTKDLARIREHMGLPPLSPTIQEMSGLTTGLITLKDLLQEGRPREWRAWLTLDEAVAYSGLIKSDLVYMVQIGIIYTRGQERARKFWRVQRAALDTYGASRDPYAPEADGSEAHQ